MTKEDRYEVEMLAEDCQQAAVRLAEATRLKAHCDAKFRECVRRIEEQDATKRPSEVTHAE